jgi:hypothetical protein
VIEGSISGSVATANRPRSALLDRTEAGAALIVTKMDRLGRDVIDMRQTVERFIAGCVIILRRWKPFGIERRCPIPAAQYRSMGEVFSSPSPGLHALGN